MLKQKKEAKNAEKKEVVFEDVAKTEENVVIKKKERKPKKQVIIEEDATSSDSEEEVVVVKKKKEKKPKIDNDKLDAIHSAINELVSYKKTKIEAKNNYLKYQESKLKSLIDEKPKVEEDKKEAPTSVAPTSVADTSVEDKKEIIAIEEPVEIELPSFKSLGNNRFNKRGF